MSEHDEMPAPLDPWVRAALLAEGLEGGPSSAQKSRMATKLAATLGLSAAALLGRGGPDGGGDGGDGGDGDGGAGGAGGAGSGSSGGGGLATAGAGAGAATVAAGTTVAGKTAALVIGAVIAGGGVGATISELRPRSQPATHVARSERPRSDERASTAPTDDAGARVDAAIDDTASRDEPIAADARIDVPTNTSADDVYAPTDVTKTPRDGARRDGARRDGAPRDGAPRMTADELARERQLIDVARSALRSGDLQLAGKSLIEHAMRFPRGVLVEEQRVLSIELFAAKGDLAGAKAAANAFRREYPRSVFRARVDAIAPP